MLCLRRLRCRKGKPGACQGTDLSLEETTVEGEGEEMQAGVLLLFALVCTAILLVWIKTFDSYPLTEGEQNVNRKHIIPRNGLKPPSGWAVWYQYVQISSLSLQVPEDFCEHKEQNDPGVCIHRTVLALKQNKNSETDLPSTQHSQVQLKVGHTGVQAPMV